MTALVLILVAIAVAIVLRSLFVQWQQAADRANELRAERLSLARDALRAHNGPPVGKVSPPEAFEKTAYRAGTLRSIEHDWMTQ